jgi:hypothetical protein
VACDIDARFRECNVIAAAPVAASGEHGATSTAETLLPTTINILVRS